MTITRTLHTKNGVVTRQLTAAEISNLAATGDQECKLESLKSEWQTAATVADKVQVLAKALRLI